MTTVLPVLVTIFLFGCGGSKGPVLKVHEAASARYGSAGAEAAAAGDYERAASLFARSLEVNRSVDNRLGETEDSINLARVLIMLGRSDEALRYLGNAQMLALEAGDKGLIAHIYATRAKLLFIEGGGAEGGGEGDAREVFVMIERAMAKARAAGGGRVGGILNLKAAVLAREGRVEEASATLDEAIRVNKKAGGVEYANSLRAKAALTGSIELYEAALEIDRDLGDTAKIGADLKGLGELYLKEGRSSKAAFHLDRAYKVFLTARMKTEALRCMETLIDLYRESGDEAAAVDVEEARERVGGE